MLGKLQAWQFAFHVTVRRRTDNIAGIGSSMFTGQVYLWCHNAAIMLIVDHGRSAMYKRLGGRQGEVRNSFQTLFNKQASNQANEHQI